MASFPGDSALPSYQVLAPFYDQIFRVEDFTAVFAPALPVIRRELVEDHGLRILDLCCGTGRALSLFRTSKDASLWGVDINEAMLKTAIEKFEKTEADLFREAHFISNDIRGLSAAMFDTNFDLILMAGVSMQHFRPHERAAILKFVFECLREGGLFIFDILKEQGKGGSILKDTLELEDRTVVIVYYRSFESDRARHHNIAVEIPKDKIGEAILHHDCFEFYPLLRDTAQSEALSAGFISFNEIKIEQASSSFLCVQKPRRNSLKIP